MSSQTVDSPLFFHKTVENERYRWPSWPSPILPHGRESKTVLDSGFHLVYSGFPLLDSSLCLWNLDSGFQSSMGFRIRWAVFQIPKPRILDPTGKIFFEFWIPQAKISWILESDSLIWCESLAWRWLSHLLRGPGTVWEESLNPDARLLGKVETNYKMAASDGEGSTPTILRKNWGTWTVYSHHDAVVKVTTKRKTHKGKTSRSPDCHSLIRSFLSVLI